MLLAPSELDTIRVPYQQGLRTWVGQVSGGNRTRFGAAGEYCAARAAKEKQERRGKVTRPFFEIKLPIRTVPLIPVETETYLRMVRRIEGRYLAL